MKSSIPSGPANPVILWRVVQGTEKVTQFQSAIEDTLDQPLGVISLALGKNWMSVTVTAGSFAGVPDKASERDLLTPPTLGGDQFWTLANKDK